MRLEDCGKFSRIFFLLSKVYKRGTSFAKMVYGICKRVGVGWLDLGWSLPILNWFKSTYFFENVKVQAVVAQIFYLLGRGGDFGLQT